MLLNDKKERNGKCFLVDGRDWMTPWEFRVFSGSLENYWLRVILIQEVFKSDYGVIGSGDLRRLVDERQKADWIQEWRETLKQFVTRNELLQRHSQCSDYQCLINPVNRDIVTAFPIFPIFQNILFNQFVCFVS